MPNIKKHIVLYNPQQEEGKTKIDISLALLSIAAIPYEEGYKIHYVNNSDSNALEKAIDYSRGSLCVAFSVMTGYQIKDALKVSRAIKNKYPEVKIVWGGWHPSILPEQTIQNELIDLIAVGQGQRTFAELVRALDKNQPLEKVKGILYKQDGKIKKTEPRTFEDINNFPPLPYGLIDGKGFIRNVDEVATRIIDYFTSQGCPHRCRFCADPLVYKHRTTMLKPERIITDIEHLINDYGINGVICTDTNFFIDEKRVREICKSLIENGIKISWGSMNGRTEHLLRLSDDTWKLLKECNFSSFLVGAESGSDESLRFIQKDATVKDTLELAKKCKQYGFKAYYSFMLGLPPNPDLMEPYSLQIKKDWKALIKITKDILSISKDNMFYFLIYTPYPGTAFYELCKKNGLKEPGSLEQWGDFTLDRVKTPWMPREYVSLLEQMNMLFIPFLTGSIYVKLGKYGLLGKAVKIAFLPLHGLVMLRWKFEFFSLPVEYKLMKLARKIARKISSI